MINVSAILTPRILAARDWLTYKAFPFVLKHIERLEAPVYARQKLEINPLVTSATRNKDRLFLVYGRGGGADKYAEQAASKIEAQGAAAWMLRFEPLKRRFVLTRGKVHGTNSVAYRFPSQYSQMIGHLQALGLGYLHIQHTRYLPLYLLSELPDLAAKLGIPYDYMIHDFIALCPRVHLIDKEYQYCGMPADTNVCNNCIAANGSFNTQPGDVALWRGYYKQLLAKATSVMAPSNDAADRHKTILGDMPITVIAHDTPPIKPRSLPVLREDEPYTVAIIGHIHRYKGADVLRACVYDALARDLPLRFMVAGSCVYGYELESLGVEITGRFKEEALPGLLEESRCSLVFLPSVWPETYSYVLSHIWQYGYFPVAFDMGAPAERIKAMQNGALLPWDMVNSPSLINDALLKAAHEQHQ